MSNYQQSQSQSAGGAPSAETLEQLSISLQQQLPKQTGTLLMDHQGTVLASSGDLKEVGERVSRWLLTLLQDANGLFVHSQTTERAPNLPPGGREELARITIAFKTYQYALSLTDSLVVCVKSNLD